LRPVHAEADLFSQVIARRGGPQGEVGHVELVGLEVEELLGPPPDPIGPVEVAPGDPAAADDLPTQLVQDRAEHRVDLVDARLAREAAALAGVTPDLAE